MERKGGGKENRGKDVGRGFKERQRGVGGGHIEREGCREGDGERERDVGRG